MFNNPFTPVFGGKPDFFFGRKELLARFDRALEVRGSEDRALFITGTRGSGKTALVEQFIQRAESAGWDVFDVSGETALPNLFRQIQPYDETTSTVDPSVEIKVLGSGGAIKGKASAKTTYYSLEDFNTLFLDACKKSPKGIFVAIDEIQKTPIEHIACICDAFQKASKKGYETVLIAAGLPYAHGNIIQHDGCTYMRRSVHEELGLFHSEEVEEAFTSGFRRTKGIQLPGKELSALVSYSSGHPYIIQLLGYHLVEFINGKAAGKTYSVTRADIETAAPVALEAYERRALQPLLDAMSEGQRNYLAAASNVMDENHLASTGKIAEYMGKKNNGLTVYREALLNEGIITAPEHGKVRFAIPYLRTYVTREPKEALSEALLDHWEV